MNSGPGQSLDAHAERLRPVLLPAVFALTAAGMYWVQPLRFENPGPEVQPAPAWASNPALIRHPSLKPETEIAGFRYRCSDCHHFMVPPAEQPAQLTQHRHIVLKHGINARCLNCHHRDNRDALAGDGDEEIPYGQPFRLCARCHGPVYRDWQHGAHGRTSGYWDTRRGPQRRALCIECHDPHQPPFPPMPPAPPPRTLRMGSPVRLEPGELVRDPLRTYRSGASTSAQPPDAGASSTQEKGKEQEP